MTEPSQFLFPGILAVVGIIVFVFGFKAMFKYSLIQNIPRSKVRSMAMGLVEIQGNAIAEKYIITPFSQSQCVYYQYRIEEYRAQRTKDGTTYTWETIASGEKRIPFYGKDETGQVYIDPNGAEFNVDEKKVFLQKAGLFGGIGSIINALKGWDQDHANGLNMNDWGLTPLDPRNHFSFGDSVGDRKYYEFYIEPEENLFVLGTAANDSNTANSVLIKRGENERTFIISDKSEKQLLGSVMGQMVLMFLIGGGAFVGGIFWILKIVRVI